MPLMIGIMGARGLRAADWLPSAGGSDPYCECEINGKTRLRTEVVNDSLNPVWNHEAAVRDYKVGDRLVFRVFDKDFEKQADLLGTATLTPEQFLPHGFDGELPLNEAGKNIKAFLKLRVKPA